MDWLLVLLGLTAVVRGLGAGMIYDVALISLPVRRSVGPVAYAEYARALFAVGLKTYGPISILGALLTLTVTVVAFVGSAPAAVAWSSAFSLLATVVALFGTSRALPAVLSLRNASDDQALLSATLDRFARWHSFSAIWQMVAFLASVVALAAW